MSNKAIFAARKKTGTRCPVDLHGRDSFCRRVIPIGSIFHNYPISVNSNKTLSTKNAAIWSKRLYYSDSFGFLGDKCLSIPRLKVSRLLFGDLFYRFRRQHQVNGIMKNSSKCALLETLWPAQPVDRIAAGKIKYKLLQGLFTCL